MFFVKVVLKNTPSTFFLTKFFHNNIIIIAKLNYFCSVGTICNMIIRPNAYGFLRFYLL